MSTGALVVAALVKIVFVLLVTVGAFAPLLVWAERRQSAMIQDRLGPRRAGIVLPPGAVALVDAARPGLYKGAVLTGLLALAALATWLFAGTFREWGLVDGEGLLSVSTATVKKSFLGFAVLSVLLRVGYGVHTMIVNNRGNIALLGMLHPLADAIKFIFKEDFVPPKADKLLHSAAPIIALVPAIVTFAVIPFADVLHLEYWNKVLPVGGDAAATQIPLQVASLNVGILFLFAIASTGIIGAAVAGYASDNKFSLLGGVRAASQMVSYEVALGLTLVPAFMIYQSLRLEDMARWQHEHVWGIFLPPLTIGFILFFTAAVAETKRIPFDLPEGESELVGGYLTEYSGMKFGMFFMSEFVEVVALSAIAAILFFGGWDVPWLLSDGFHLPAWLIGAVGSVGVELPAVIELPHAGVLAIQVGGFLLKIIVFIWFQLMIRWALPRFRYDQVMALCWKGLLPASLILILLTGLFLMPWGLDAEVAPLDSLVTMLEKVL